MGRMSLTLIGARGPDQPGRARPDVGDQEFDDSRPVGTDASRDVAVAPLPACGGSFAAPAVGLAAGGGACPGGGLAVAFGLAAAGFFAAEGFFAAAGLDAAGFFAVAVAAAGFFAAALTAGGVET